MGLPDILDPIQISFKEIGNDPLRTVYTTLTVPHDERGHISYEPHLEALYRASR